MKILNFLSTYEHYDVEEPGIKPYTIRKDTPRLRKMMQGKTHLRIQRAYTMTSFTRKITHVLFWEGWIVFAWNPNKRKMKLSAKLWRIYYWLFTDKMQPLTFKELMKDDGE